MSHIMSRGIYYALLTILVVPSALIAQKPQAAPQAPVPSQIATAKKVFISNAGGEDTPFSQDESLFSEIGPVYSGGPDRAYNQLYLAMKEWGRYELVSAPADADLVFQISFQLPRFLDTEISTAKGANTGRFRLAIVDPKTHVALWAFMENVESFNRKKTGDRNFDRALARLVESVKTLVARTG